jgi:hypothetical protein
LGFLVLGVGVLAYAAASALMGKTYVSWNAVLESVEPRWFWLLVKFQLGAGIVLLLLGLLGRKRKG